MAINNFANQIKEKMRNNSSGIIQMEKIPGHEHVCVKLQDNFINGNVPSMCSVKGDKFGNRKIHYHRYARSLNSSQVMCISFFHVLFSKNSPQWNDYLLELLRRCGICIPKAIEIVNAIFEYEPDEKERTNFDFYLKLSNGSHIFFEIKFTEAGFGKVILNDKTKEKYCEKWNMVYQKLVNNNPYLSCYCEDQFYKTEYQINRNIVWAKKDDFVVFLTPRANTKLDGGRKYIDSFHKKYSNILNLYWEDVIGIMMEIVKDDANLLQYYEKFKSKYIDVLF